MCQATLKSVKPAEPFGELTPRGESPKPRLRFYHLKNIGMGKVFHSSDLTGMTGQHFLFGFNDLRYVNVFCR